MNLNMSFRLTNTVLNNPSWLLKPIIPDPEIPANAILNSQSGYVMNASGGYVLSQSVFQSGVWNDNTIWNDSHTWNDS